MECTHCRLGHYQLDRLPYFTFLDEQLMVIPNVPAYRCDMCGHIRFNELFLYNLQYLIDRLTDRAPDDNLPHWVVQSEQAPEWSATRRSR